MDGKSVRLKGYEKWLQIYQVDGLRYSPGMGIDTVREFNEALADPFKKGSSARGRRAKTKKPKSIFVQGRRWRDSYGNTYHTADIIVDEYKVYTTPITYGYGDHYVDTTATEWLVEQGYLKGGKRRCPAWTLAREQGIDFDYAAENVRRKKDL